MMSGDGLVEMIWGGGAAMAVMVVFSFGAGWPIFSRWSCQLPSASRFVRLGRLLVLLLAAPPRAGVGAIG